MFHKEYLQAGMLVKLRTGDFAIVAHDSYDNNELFLSWNDGSARCLSIEHYNYDLTYHDDIKKYDIMQIYDHGNFDKPFTMDYKERILLWDRNNSNKFSLKERAYASGLELFFSRFASEDSQYEIFLEGFSDHINLNQGDTRIRISAKYFPNVDNRRLRLTDILHGEVL